MWNLPRLRNRLYFILIKAIIVILRNFWLIMVGLFLLPFVIIIGVSGFLFLAFFAVSYAVLYGIFFALSKVQTVFTKEEIDVSNMQNL